MKFVKMHGCGNDYVYLDAVTDASIARRIEEPGWRSLVQRMSDRHKGIGSDGVIVLCPASGGTVETGGTGSSPARGVANSGVSSAHVRMRMFNADGSESEMCGNGIRCVAKFAHDRLNIRANPMLVETGRGVLGISYETVEGKMTMATVDMGEPINTLSAIPVDPSALRQHERGYELHNVPRVDDWQFVSMGNPHATSFLLGDDVSQAQVLSYLSHHGRQLECNPAFPNRANIHVVTRVAPNGASVVTWERGAGITQACGTGACAVLVAGVLTGRLDREADIHVLGGTLHIRWDEATNHVFMTGPAEDICEGEWPEDRR